MSRRWRWHLLVLGAVWLVLVALFWRDVVQLVGLWWTNTTYGHCLFILPVVGWLVWQRRAQLAELRPQAWWPGLALVALGGAGWLMGEAGTVTFARQLGLVLMCQGAVVTLLGPMVARGVLFPLAYALFAVPFGQELEPPLQRVTVAIVMPLLHLAGVPAAVDGVLIQAGAYRFEVAEACSGSKFVLAMLAFGVLVANLCFRRWTRRAAFLAACLVVPVLANGVRAWGTIYGAQLFGIEAAAGFDHIVFGWLFFAAVMAAVLAIGWRWFDRAPDDPAFDPASLSGVPRRRVGLIPGAALVIATAAVFPSWAAMTGGRVATLPAQMVLPDVPGWHRAPLGSAWQPWYPAADHYLFGRYVDARGRPVDVGVAVFAEQHGTKKMVAFGTGVLREDDRWVRVADLAPIAGGSAMRIVAPGPVERIVATWYRVGGETTADERRVKMVTMKARLLGEDRPATAIHLSTEGRDPAAIADFVAATGGTTRFADRLTAAR